MKKEVKSQEKVVEAHIPSEKDQLLDRQSELLIVLDFLATNKFQDRGQIEVALSKVNQRLTEI